MKSSNSVSQRILTYLFRFVNFSYIFTNRVQFGLSETFKRLNGHVAIRQADHSEDRRLRFNPAIWTFSSTMFHTLSFGDIYGWWVLVGEAQVGQAKIWTTSQRRSQSAIRTAWLLHQQAHIQQVSSTSFANTESGRRIVTDAFVNTLRLCVVQYEYKNWN